VQKWFRESFLDKNNSDGTQPFTEKKGCPHLFPYRKKVPGQIPLQKKKYAGTPLQKKGD
jgi:hypothetical protein